MARPRKWGSDAERMAARRAQSGVNEHVAGVNEHAGPVNEHDQAPDVRIAGVNEHADVRIEMPGANYPEIPDSSPGFIRFRHQPHVPMSLFDGAGRGSPRRHTDGRDYVLVSRHAGSDLGELGIVSAADWSARLNQSCEHGQAGWACHGC